jgi:hypothetical protein
MACHDLDAFKPPRFTTADHAKTPFALTGAHAAAECRACHGARREGLPPFAAADVERFGTAAFAFRIPERICADCHTDPHAGKFAARAACQDCHGTASFGPARVGVAEHATYRFRLEGAHRAVLCVDCHKDLAAGVTWAAKARARGRSGGVAALVNAAERAPSITFAVAKQECADCHDDPHAAQFSKPAVRGLECRNCHVVASFRPAPGFDHARTAFPLDGAHRGVACGRCHGMTKSTSGARFVRYRGTPTACEACHAVTGDKR